MARGFAADPGRNDPAWTSRSPRWWRRSWSANITLSWLILALPGAVLYMLTGKNRLGRARLKDHAGRDHAAYTNRVRRHAPAR